MAKVLIVDDDLYILDLYKEILKDEGFDVETATDGEEALEKIRESTLDLVLMDIMMPKMDGITVLSKMKDDVQLKTIPVMMLTNFGQENLVKQAINLGSSEFLLKYKITPGEMVEKVKQLLSPSAVHL